MSVVTNASYGYSEAGCVTSMVYTGAAYSRNLGLSWNSQYQLTSASTNGTEVESYGHDALGRRIYIARGSTTNWLVYDGVQVVAEVNGSGQLQKSYTWGPGIDHLLAMTVYSGSTTNTYYALTDHLGTVHALADSSGAIVESYRFDAWGRLLGVYDSNNQQLSNSAIGNRYLWQGREYSWATGLYFFRARWYDPVTGRWLSNDPIGISGGLNQYVFCNNNPVMARDPLGLSENRVIESGAYRFVKYAGDRMHGGTHWHVYARKGGQLLGRVSETGKVLTGNIPKSALKRLLTGATFAAAMIALEPNALGAAEIPGYQERASSWREHAFDVFRQGHYRLPENWYLERSNQIIMETWVRHWLRKNPMPNDYEIELSGGGANSESEISLKE